MWIKFAISNQADVNCLIVTICGNFLLRVEQTSDVLITIALSFCEFPENTLLD